MTTYAQVLAAMAEHEAEAGDDGPLTDPVDPPGFDPMSDWTDADWLADEQRGTWDPWPDLVDQADHYRKQQKEGD